MGLDPDTLGGTFTYQIKQNEPASYAVLAMLEEFGYGGNTPGRQTTAFISAGFPGAA